MKPFFLLIAFVGTASIAIGQPSPSQAEDQIKASLNKKVKASDWANVTNLFEAYLVASNFGTKSDIANAYVNFLEHQSSFPVKEPLPLTNRAKVKQSLLNARIIDGKKTYSHLFIECFYNPHKDYEKLPESTVKDIIAIGDVLSQMDVASRILYGSLADMFKVRDFDKDIYKRAVILLCLPELIYSEEVSDQTAGADNPILRMLETDTTRKR